MSERTNYECRLCYGDGGYYSEAEALREAGLVESATSRAKPTYYLAAPYSASPTATIAQNVDYATWWWNRLTDAGYHVVCPHIQSQMLDPHGTRGDDFWYSWTLALMRCCDAVVLLPDGPMPRMSVGVSGEVAEAMRLRIEIVEADDLIS